MVFKNSIYIEYTFQGKDEELLYKEFQDAVDVWRKEGYTVLEEFYTTLHTKHAGVNYYETELHGTLQLEKELKDNE